MNDLLICSLLIFFWACLELDNHFYEKELSKKIENHNTHLLNEQWTFPDTTDDDL